MNKVVAVILKKEIPTFDLKEKSDLPLWVQLSERLAYLIESGYYEAGEQLPSVRKFAAEIRISYNTVSKAFMALEREGFIVTKHGSGAYVNDLSRVDGHSEIDVLAEEFVKSCISKGIQFDEIPQVVNQCIRRLRSAQDEEG